ncbi:DUF3108 domain-containing protein [Paenalcaligenes niemegkensis]|uniref:DUF3108 domain-containing protein n=1 Tax=Paenalcaligenes niemegkensis TaxID=2895469 RepID=UPI001EE8E775|nr:DUF3108 domain-containing protein [Paenalcaligenes niemegkensis]MCQ9615700.1 DUF3108 domain-containing protein [Paenalcaligenes niemegkensis]
MTYQLRSLITVPFLNQRQQRSRKLFLKKYALLCAALFCFDAVQAQNIDYVDASFSVEYNNQSTQGESRLMIQQAHNRYEVNFELDHWLLSSGQKATFEMDQCQVHPISYISTNKRPLKNETIQTLTFDRDHKKAEYSSEGEQKIFDLDSPLYDPLSFFFEARCDLMAGQTEFTYPLIHKGKKEPTAIK